MAQFPLLFRVAMAIFQILTGYTLSERSIDVLYFTFRFGKELTTFTLFQALTLSLFTFFVLIPLLCIPDLGNCF